MQQDLAAQVTAAGESTLAEMGAQALGLLDEPGDPLRAEGAQELVLVILLGSLHDVAERLPVEVAEEVDLVVQRLVRAHLGDVTGGEIPVRVDDWRSQIAVGAEIRRDGLQLLLRV